MYGCYGTAIRALSSSFSHFFCFILIRYRKIWHEKLWTWVLNFRQKKMHVFLERREIFVSTLRSMCVNVCRFFLLAQSTIAKQIQFNTARACIPCWRFESKKNRLKPTKVLAAFAYDKGKWNCNEIQGNKIKRKKQQLQQRQTIKIEKKLK